MSSNRNNSPGRDISMSEGKESPSKISTTDDYPGNYD